MIRVQSLTKCYRRKIAVDDIDFTVESGKVTGFLGPNGAGKTTTMRMIVGLDEPSSGTAEVRGRKYRDLQSPLREVGVLLDARAALKSRSAYKHLLAIAATHRIGPARVREVMGMTGIEDVANKRVGGFSLGMGQRLGIAAALLGDPGVIILDEPINGLDPDGVLWVRSFLRQLAAEGRTVLLSSHLMSEMAQTADQLIVIGRGRILADGPLQDVMSSATTTVVRVRTHRAEHLVAALARDGVTLTSQPDGAIDVSGMTSEEVADAAASEGIVLYEVSTHAGSLEQAYLALTEGSAEYTAASIASKEENA
ncbi:ATP-binding cassette domain-containing protein [Pseudoclavibacter chungangensis]|uniref:ATP-binding cassette domain-containing protein n=1 Tax=Pseudoclavibacter chungangensis TaxID=587635 RepID=A0A7J5BLX0_9MICO|nr:ATP-binding cassette domain-containing protein [Pseudoclavibacter chungangensis]KAB1651807.1 ATP-binding cassette domain-containing protein [Pseudoclavibacter chungangensis]